MGAREELPFRVSARTARLIGRESVATAEGAIGELVKNAYDADASFCIIRFSKLYESPPDKITAEEFENLERWGLNPDEHYEKIGNAAKIRPGLIDAKGPVAQLIDNLVDLSVIDDGSGMTVDVIKKAWMVIGTGNKEAETLSKAGRTRTGAKGIGRFALDKLGTRCALFSRSELSNSSNSQSLSWHVDWTAFEKDGAVLDQIKATVQTDTPAFVDEIDALISQSHTNGFSDILVKKTVATGTVIKINGLRDRWTKRVVEALRRSLGVLVPPDEQRKFEVFLVDNRDEDPQFRVGSDILEDFDYKLHAKVDKNGQVQFSIVRNELDHSAIPPKLFDRSDMTRFPFRKEDFVKREVIYAKPLHDLLPKREDAFYQRARAIGSFEVTLRFFKLTAPSAHEDRPYPYRSYQPARRNGWLDFFGGIRIYRDNFGVRPYGEPNSSASDWLSLGKRRAANPAAPSRKSWTVPAQNIAGTITISRNENHVLNDQSNREGIIETDEFAVFREIILRLIRELESDRSHILFNLLELYNELNENSKTKAEGTKIASRVTQNPKDSDETTVTLSKTVQVQQAELEDMRQDQVILRSLATLGTVMVSFAHEMGQLNTMAGRNEELAMLLRQHLDEGAFKDRNPAFNPFQVLRDWETSDRKATQWFRFALSSVKPERRRRSRINFRKHLLELKATWVGFLQPRHIEIELIFEPDFDAEILAFEIDIDSIFNNLILNSYEALVEGHGADARQIKIEIKRVRSREIEIAYSDNGPGLHSSILDPNDIFQFTTTTKTDPEGQATGTGLGMWILDAVVRNYGGTARAIRQKEGEGFRLVLSLPIAKEGDE